MFFLLPVWAVHVHCTPLGQNISETLHRKGLYDGGLSITHYQYFLILIPSGALSTIGLINCFLTHLMSCELSFLFLIMSLPFHLHILFVLASQVKHWWYQRCTNHSAVYLIWILFIVFSDSVQLITFSKFWSPYNSNSTIPILSS